jgi:hypothetical protein
MKRQQIIFILLIAFSALSFGKRKPPVITGTYGVCSCTLPAKTIIELKLNPDGSFAFTDNSDPSHAIDIKGTWSMKKGNIVLSGFKPDNHIHDRWHMDKNGKCIKSRKGMEFSRLCNQDSCK